MIEFKNYKDLMGKLSDEKACRAHMEEMRWSGEPVCPHCGGRKPYRLKDGKTYRCKERTCRKNFTVTTGTVFENTKIPLSTWIAATYVLTAHKKGISSHQLARDLGVTQKTAWFVLQRLRYIMDEPGEQQLTNSVEVDETYIGGTFANMNRERRKRWQEAGMDNKVAVMGLLERDGKARLTVIGKKSFKDVVRENVNPDAIIITDTHLAYQGLQYEYAGHFTVNHSQMQFKNGIACTNTVEGFFSQLSRSIFGIYHSVSPKHLERYCAETAYRYNNRKITDKERFTITLQNPQGRLTYNNLIQKETK
jgi:transposase-like protein